MPQDACSDHEMIIFAVAVGRMAAAGSPVWMQSLALPDASVPLSRQAGYSDQADALN